MDKYDREKRALGYIILGGVWGCGLLVGSLRIVKAFSLGQRPDGSWWLILAISAIILVSLFNEYLRIAGLVISAIIMIVSIGGLVLDVGWGIKGVEAFQFVCLLVLGLIHADLYAYTLAGSPPAMKLWRKISSPEA